MVTSNVKDKYTPWPGKKSNHAFSL